MQGQPESLRDTYFERTAFLLNANAKRVTDRIVGQLIQIVPAGDLFYSRNQQDAEQFIQTIVKRGYGRLFVGGGDGTIMHATTILQRIKQEHPEMPLPNMGVLKLGTGNALAGYLHATNALTDVKYLLSKRGELAARPQYLVATQEGTVCPFAGMGYDGEILNDYRDYLKRYEGAPLRGLRESVLGYAWAGVSRLLPRRVVAEKPYLRIRSSKPAYRIVHENGVDKEIEIPAGTLLYDGHAPIVSVGAIPYFGYGFKMFPFAIQKEGHIQLRVSACSVFTLIQHIIPGGWNGTFRHEDLHDFLIQDVEIESSIELPYQVGGDACGYQKVLTFKAQPSPVDLIHFPEGRQPAGLLSFMPHLSFAQG